MKKAYIIKNYQSGWGIQNRVEALVDWGRDGLTPYEIDILGQNALITVDDAKKASYESEYQWEQDIATMNGLLNDIQDPIFADDGQILKSIDMESTTPDAVKDFTQFAIENCSTLGYDMLRPLGLDMPKSEEEPEVASQSQTDRVKELEAMAKSINLSNGMEDINKLTPDEPIEEYSRETDPLLIKAEHVTDESDPVNEPEPAPVPSEPVADAPAVEPAVAVAVASGSTGKIVDPRKEFIDEFMDACKEYDITPKGLVSVIMSIKALANKAADVSNITAEDVTGEEDYTYSNAVPYVQNPHEKEPEIAEQGMNVPETEDNTSIGTESIETNVEEVKEFGTTSTEAFDNLNDESSFVSYDDYTEFDGCGPFLIHGIGETEYTECSTEGLFSRKKKKSDNEVINDINKVCEDLKEVAKKAWEELKEKNQDLITKYGAFIKILLDIKDVVFMEKRNIVLEVADFYIKKANNEIVPDSTEEMILKQVSKASIGLAFGPFAQLASSEDKPGQTMLIMANDLRAHLIKYLKTQNLDITPAVELIEHELQGSYKLVVSFKDLPKISNESLTEDIPLIERLAKESADDNELFDKVLEHKSEIDYKIAMECVNTNMWNYFKTGERIVYDRSVSGQRIVRYIKK